MTAVTTTASLSPPGSDAESSPDLAITLQPLYTRFFQDLQLTQPFERFESDKLMDAVLEFARETGVPHPPNSHSYQSLMNCLPYHDLEVKVYVAIYTWLATLCDDAELVDTVQDIALFQQRWMLDEKQPSIVLQAFSDQLRLTYKLYHPLVANLIVVASFNLMTSTALVAREGIKNKTKCPSPGGQNFSWYIRERDGVGEAYAWFTFSKSQFPDLDIPIEAIDDMARFIALANDVLSFYKEMLAGEVDNYISTKAAYSGSGYVTALKETAKDAIDCARRIESVLSGKGEYERAWRLHATGYIQMHVMRGRYRLWELGLGHNPCPEEVLRETPK
ncbi:terpene cyclase [Neopestalotiopsis sp. 37M]|nr:terpene cyclase [Neopestalotiopsis sp. 37M]